MSNEEHHPPTTEEAQKVDPANPYNVDYERERRLKRTFQVLIGLGFILACLMILAGFMMDAMMPREDDVAPITPYGTPSAPKTPGTPTQPTTAPQE